MIRGSSVAESGETGARSGWFVALSGKSALSRGSLGPLGRNMHADDSGVSRGRVGAESGKESALFVAPSATSGGVVTHSCLVGAHSRQANKIQISTIAFLACSWHVLGRFVVKLC